MTASEIYEVLAIFLSSTGALGAALSALLAVMLRRARQDAEKKRSERISLELQRMEGEERLSEVVLALVRVCGPAGATDPELTAALQSYSQYLEARKTLRNQILSNYTVK